MAVPSVVSLGGTHDVQTSDTERSLSESGIRRLRSDPWHISVLVVACVTENQVSNAARIDGVVVHRIGSLIGMDVSVHHDIHTVLVEKRLVIPSEDLSLLVVAGVGAVKWDVDLDHDPRSAVTVYLRKVSCQPLIL